jgi:hypothetical protein
MLYDTLHFKWVHCNHFFQYKKLTKHFCSKSSLHQNASSSSTTVASTGSKRRVFNPRSGNRLDKTYTEADESDDGDVEAVSVSSNRKRSSRGRVDIAPSSVGTLKNRNAATKVAAADPIAITRSLRRKK